MDLCPFVLMWTHVDRRTIVDINHQPADVARDEAANHFCFLAIVLGNGLAGQMRDPNSSVSLVASNSTLHLSIRGCVLAIIAVL